MKLPLIAILALAAAQPAASQDDGGDAAAIADRLWGIDERLKSINTSNAHVLWASAAIAIVAAGAAICYATQLRKQLKLAENDARHRLRPVLAWRMFDDGSQIRVSSAGDRPSGLTIRVINTGQVSAGDIVVYHNARLVGGGAPPAHKMRRLGALGPGDYVDLHIPMSAENLGSTMGGGLAYMEAIFSYSDVAGKEMGYVVAGYLSSTVSTLFDEKDMAPRGDRDKGQTRHLADAPVSTSSGKIGESIEDVTKSRKIQSFGSYAISLAASLEPHDVMARDDAHKMLEKCKNALKDDPTSATEHRNMAIALRSLGQYDDALAAIVLAEELNPMDSMTAEETARILGKLGRHDEAIGALRLALERGDNGLYASMELARTYTELGEYNEAFGAWRGIIKEDPSYEAHLGMASVCMVLRRYDSAIVALGDAIGKKPDDAFAHAQKGIAQLAYGRYEKAAATLERAIVLDGNLADAHVNLAHALYRLGREAKAIEELDRAVAVDPDNHKVHIDRGVRMLEMGRLKEARESFAEARRLDPSMLVPQARAGFGGGRRRRGGRRDPEGARRRQAGHAR